ncbi:hypothetical protein FDB14_17460 [Clostridium botulinum]|nr:hypothetical protein [Clostridium botulinum]NFK69440.1 hypothetical protein [Clostridium botulinum]NFK97952.1 hypothetical protein [Clostridium botulinum]
MDEYLYLEFKQGFQSLEISEWTKLLESFSFPFKMSRPVSREINTEELIKNLEKLKNNSNKETQQYLNCLNTTTKSMPKVIFETIIYFRVENQNTEELKKSLEKIGTVKYVSDKYLNDVKKIFGDIILNIEYASRIKFAEIKEDWDRCLNGRWYNSIYNCDCSDIAQIMERLEQDEAISFEPIEPWNSEDTIYNQIISFEEDEEIEMYAVKVTE